MLQRLGGRNKLPLQSDPVAKSDGIAIIKKIQSDVFARDKEVLKQKLRERLSLRDWRKG
jgi:hypothetical protein